MPYTLRIPALLLTITLLATGIVGALVTDDAALGAMSVIL